MKSAIIVFPGSNRDGDLARALRRATGVTPVMAWHADTALPDGVDLVALPGGFSYGDYLRCGAIAARSPIMRAVAQHASNGGLVLGICNGFQILCEAGLLPGVLGRNRAMSFICRDVHLRVERTDTPFTSQYAPGTVIRVPVAHGEGNYIATPDVIERLEGEGRVAFRYVDASGAATVDANINGSVNAIAGIYSENMRVLGLMPHPENAIEAINGSTGGMALFAGLAAARGQAA